MRGGQPAHAHVGAIDNEASDKGARFIRFSDAFDIPLVFVRTHRLCPWNRKERDHQGGGGSLRYAVVEADVLKVTITIRKSHGGAYAVMGSKQLTADLNFALAHRAHRGDRRRRGREVADEAFP